MTNGLQPNPMISHGKLIHKTATKIDNHFRAFLKLILCKTNNFAFRQVLETALPKKILQNSVAQKKRLYGKNPFHAHHSTEYTIEHTSGQETEGSLANSPR